MMQFVTALAGILTAFFIGFFIISLKAKDLELQFRVLFAIPIGFGLTSILYFLSMILNFYNFYYYVAIELFLLLYLGLAYFSMEKKHTLMPKPKFSLALGLSTLFGILIYMRYFVGNAMGSWDGFRIWNIKAQFMYQSSWLWRRVFDLPHFMMHDDYPLFIPSSVARLWKYAGVDSFDVNNLLGLIFTFAIIYLLYFTIKKYKNNTLAVVVASVVALCGEFLVNGAAQSADIPMAYFVLCSSVALLFFFDKKENIYLVLGASFAGLSAWTKNEGMMFFLFYLCAVGFYFLKSKDYKRLWISFSPALIFLPFLAFFKFVAHSPNDLITGITKLHTYLYILKASRHVMIIQYFFKYLLMRFWTLFPLIILCSRGFEFNDEQKTPLKILLYILGFMCAGYYFVYLFTAHVLLWQLENSLPRIILQVMPMFVLILALSLKLGQKDNSN